jgi:hypothetical protein
MALRGRRAAFTCIRQLLTFSGPFFVLSLRRARMAPKPRQGRRGFSLFRVFGLSIVDLEVSRPGLEPGT